MTTLTINEAKSQLYELVEQVGESHEPVFIRGEQTNAVLMAEEDWRAIQETLFLLNVPGMRESIIEGLNTPIEACSDEVEW
jgi:antitoxin YefM